MQEAKPDIEVVANASPSYRVQRKLRPKQGTPLPHDRLAHVRMVLVEYGHSANQLAGPLGLERKEGSASPLAAKLKGMGLEAGGGTPEASGREHGLRKAQMEAAAASMAEVLPRSPSLLLVSVHNPKSSVLKMTRNNLARGPTRLISRTGITSRLMTFRTHSTQPHAARTNRHSSCRCVTVWPHAGSHVQVGDEADVSGRKAANILGLRSDENRAAFLKYNQVIKRKLTRQMPQHCSELELELDLTAGGT